MGVLLGRNRFKRKTGGAIKVDDNPNKFNSVPSGIIGQNNILTGQKAPISLQSNKPTTSTVTYGTDLLQQVNFKRNDRNKDKKVKLKI